MDRRVLVKELAKDQVKDGPATRLAASWVALLEGGLIGRRTVRGDRHLRSHSRAAHVTAAPGDHRAPRSVPGPRATTPAVGMVRPWYRRTRPRVSSPSGATPSGDPEEDVVPPRPWSERRPRLARRKEGTVILERDANLVGLHPAMAMIAICVEAAFRDHGSEARISDGGAVRKSERPSRKVKSLPPLGARSTSGWPTFPRRSGTVSRIRSASESAPQPWMWSASPTPLEGRTCKQSWIRRETTRGRAGWLALSFVRCEGTLGGILPPLAEPVV